MYAPDVRSDMAYGMDSARLNPRALFERHQMVVVKPIRVIDSKETSDGHSSELRLRL